MGGGGAGCSGDSEWGEVVLGALGGVASFLRQAYVVMPLRTHTYTSQDSLSRSILSIRAAFKHTNSQNS